MSLTPTISLEDLNTLVLESITRPAVLMQRPESIVDNRERLEAVMRTGLLDTPAEESFDRLTRLAAKLVGVQATFISVVDKGRDFYKSCFGWRSLGRRRGKWKARRFVISHWSRRGLC